eukprot:UN26365
MKKYLSSSVFDSNQYSKVSSNRRSELLKKGLSSQFLFQMELDGEEEEMRKVGKFGMSLESYIALKRKIIPINQFPERKTWKLLANGAFGDVYLVNWHNCEVAIKITTNQKCIKNVILEAEILNKCVHPCVCRFLGIVLDQNNVSIWLIMNR